MLAKIRSASACVPAFWMLADDGGWPAEVDIMEGLGNGRATSVMTLPRRHTGTQRVFAADFDFTVPDASTAFQRLRVLLAAVPLTYFIDRHRGPK